MPFLPDEDTGPCDWCGGVVRARLGDDGDGYPVMLMECHRAPCGRW